MSGLLDHGTGEVLLRNFGWMLGNLWLAWVGLLIAWLILEPRRRAVWSARIMVGSAFLAASVAIALSRDAINGIPGAWIIVPPTVLAILTCIVMRWHDRRWTQILVVLTAIAFAPNAPYVLTDSMHLVQDLRIGLLDSAESLALSIQYGVFIVAGLVPWFLLLALGRRLVRLRWPRAWMPGLVFVASALASLAIYIGRIERLHSYHLVSDPGAVIRAVAHVFLHAGPAAFVAIWTIVVFVVSVFGLWAVDRIRAVGGSGRELVVPSMFALSGMFLAAVPAVAVWDAQFGVDTVTPGGADAAACILGGIVLGSIGIARIVTVLGLLVERTPQPSLETSLQPQPSLVPVLALGFILAVPIVGSLMIGAATAQWWAQYRELCNYGPGTTIHSERCP